ncbi:MAG: hypothetical protein ACODAA_03020 [Gemmatimonadota bacterium]
MTRGVEPEVGERRSRRPAAAVVIFTTLALAFAIGGTAVYVIAAAHGHGVAAADGRALVVAAIGALASAVAAVASYRRR